MTPQRGFDDRPQRTFRPQGDGGERGLWLHKAGAALVM